MSKLKEVEVRYSKIINKFPREFILLQGEGCFWRRCLFCDYFEDVSTEPFKVNKPVIDKITGEFSELDVINSGSAMEIDDETLDYLIKKVKEFEIKTIWFEAHWKYRYKLREFAGKFDGVDVKYRTGIETFNGKLRNYWNKGIPESVTPEDVAKYFDSVSLLVGTEKQTIDDVIKDISTAEEKFERYMLNVFTPNDSKARANYDLINEFMKKVYPQIKDNPKVEISLLNTDLGVG